MANLNDTITDGTAKFKVVKSATSTDVSDHNSLATAHSSGISGNAATATKLKTARTINIQDNTATNTGTGASFDGSGNVTIKLPATIKADITGNAATATNASKVNNLTVLTAVPANAKFTDTTYSAATESASGLMTAADKVKTNNLVHSAEAHNGIYRGKDLTSYFTSGQMSTDIANNDFTNIYPGDYITKTITLPAITYTNKSGTSVTQSAQTFNNVKWLVAGLDTHLYSGWHDTNKDYTAAHHVVMIPSTTLQRSVSMNPTNTTEGGYLGSDMWNVHMPNWATAIKNAFGATHVLKHNELLSNAINATALSGAGAGWTGSSSAWVWTEVEVNIPNEQMIYGGKVWGSSGHDCGDFTRILPLYVLKNRHLDDRSWFWLRSVASASNFAAATDIGNAIASGASAANAYGGVRPYFLLR